MKKIVLLALFVLLQSCYTYKVDSQRVGEPDYNNRQTIDNPSFKKRKNALGISVMGLSIAGSGYLGYKTGLIETQNGVETKPNDPLNVSLGLLVGVGTNLLIDKMFHINKVKNVNTLPEFNEWVNKANSNFITLDNNRVIPKNQDNEYVIKKIEDAYIFKNIFPNSSNTEKTISSAIIFLNRNELPKLLNLFPNNNQANKIKERFINESSTVEEMFLSNKQYNNFFSDIEEKCFQKINSSNDAKSFNDHFSNSQKTDLVFKKGLTFLNKVDYPKYINAFNNVNNEVINNSKKDYIEDCSEVNDCYNRQKNYPEYYELAAKTAIKFATSYSDYEKYLDFFEKSNSSSIIKEQYSNELRKEFEALDGSEVNYFNFFTKFKESKFPLALLYGYGASKRYEEINAGKYETFKKEIDNRDGTSLVKIILKSNNGTPAISFSNEIKRFLNDRESFAITILGAKSRGKNFVSVDNPVTYFDKCVINALWYREGTDKDGNMFIQNSGFPKFEKDFKQFSASIGTTVEYCEYLGSYRDDERKEAEERASAIKYKQEQCNKCEVDWSKTTNPNDVDGFWGKSHNSGYIVMKNGEKYEWDYSDGEFKGNFGFFSSDSFDSYQLMINDFLQQCENRYCK